MWSSTTTLIVGLLIVASYAQFNDKNEVDQYVGKGFQNKNKGFTTRVSLQSIPIAIRQRAERTMLEIAEAKLATPENKEGEKPKFGWNPFTATFADTVVPIYLPSTIDPEQPDYYEFKVLDEGRGKGYIVLTAKPYQDFLTPAVHFEEEYTLTEKTLIKTAANGFLQTDVKKFVRSNAAGDIAAEDLDGKLLSTETIASGESECPCSQHQFKQEAIVAEATQYAEIRKAAKKSWDELKINDEVGIAIPCNGYDFALSGSGENLNSIVPWEVRCKQDLASPFINRLVKMTRKSNRYLIETTEEACALLEVYKLIDNDPCNITRFTVNGQKYYVTAADLQEYDPDSNADPMDRGGESNTTAATCFMRTTYALVDSSFTRQYGSVTIQNDREPSLSILILPKAGYKITQFSVEVSTFSTSKTDCNEDRVEINIPSDMLRLSCGSQIPVRIRARLIAFSTGFSNPVNVFPVQNPPDENPEIIMYTVCCEEIITKRYYDTKPWSAWTYYYIPGEVPNYNQHSCCGCISGCGSVAWAQSFGWADRRAEIAGTGWSKDIYKSSGPSGSPAVAPLTWSGSAAQTSYTQAIRSQIDTFCAAGNGATFPWDMNDVSGWFRSRNGGNGGVSSEYNFAGYHEDRLMECVRDEITIRRQPVVMGTGWLTHYPTAVAYAHRQRQVKDCWLFCPWRWQHSRWAYVHQGWGGSGNQWIELSTWFCGKIYK